MSLPWKPVLGVAVASAVLLGAAPVHADDGDDAGRIAFASNRTGSTDVWTMSPDGSGAVDLTPVAGADVFPNWSPDGRRLVFARGSGLLRELWLMDADGTGPTQLTFNLAADNASAWSPDGTRIAVARTDADFNTDIWVVRLDGAAPDVRVTSEPGFDGFPTWSRDGAWIAFESSRGGSEAIWRTRAHGLGAAQRLTAPELNGGTPAWSNDGRRIAFVDNLCPTCDESDIWVLKVHNGRLSQVTDSPENELFPHFAPDDDRLVYERADIVDGTLLLPDIFVIPTKGGPAVNLTNSPSVLDFQPTWSPDPETGDENDA